MTLDGTVYYYLLNIQGDVMGLVDGDGNLLVSYLYEAYGECFYITDTSDMVNTLIGANPLLYRGYVFDHGTNLYYLQSRYYDPTLGRFLNADGQLSGIGGEELGYNMFSYCFNNPINLGDSAGDWPEWLEKTVKIVSAVVVVVAVVVAVAAVTYYTAGTGSAAAVYGASILLGAALAGISGGVANEAKGNSYLNGYVGGSVGGAIQAVCSKETVGTVVGGGVGATVGTAITDVMNNWDPDSSDSTAQEIHDNAITSGGKAMITSTLTAFMGSASDSMVSNGSELMSGYSFGFGEAVKTFFGWVDDAIVYIWE